jgi:hypothetical protein
MLRIIDGDSKSEIFGMVLDDEYRPGHEVLSRNDTVHVCKRKPALQCEPQATVIDVIRISTSVAITKQAIRTESVIVGPARCGRNGKGNFTHDLRFEDSLGPDDGDAHPLKLEPLGQERSGKYIAMKRDLIRQPRKSGGSYARITGFIEHGISIPTGFPRPGRHFQG